MATTKKKKHLQNKVIKKCGIIQRVLESKTTKQNIRNNGINWEVLRKFHAYNQKKRQRILCQNEKYEITCYKGDNLLNKRTEILGTYRYRNKYKRRNCH